MAGFRDWSTQLKALMNSARFGNNPLVLDMMIPYRLGWSPSKTLAALTHASERDWRELLVRSVAQKKGLEGWEPPEEVAAVLRPEDARYLTGAHSRIKLKEV